MKKLLMISLLFIMPLLLSGCGEKSEPTIVSCKYVSNEDSISAEVEMKFKRDNTQQEITNGYLSMSYVFNDVGSNDDSSFESLISTMFDGVCDELSNTYKDCDLIVGDNNVDVIMEFDLDVLESTSNGTFKKSMTVSQVKGYILAQNEIDGLVCTIE